MSENIKKVFRYDKIEKSIVETINKIAYSYSRNNPKKIADEEMLDNDSYSYACKVFANKMKVLSRDMGYITEIIIADNFDFVPQRNNPYAISGTSVDDRYARIVRGYHERGL